MLLQWGGRSTCTGGCAPPVHQPLEHELAAQHTGALRWLWPHCASASNPLLSRPWSAQARVSPCDADILEGPQDVDLGIRQHDARARRVLDRELGLAALPCQPPDAARQVLPPQRLCGGSGGGTAGKSAHTELACWALLGRSFAMPAANAAMHCTAKRPRHPPAGGGQPAPSLHPQPPATTAPTHAPSSTQRSVNNPHTLTSLISNDSTYRSSSRSSAMASCTSNPAPGRTGCCGWECPVALHSVRIPRPLLPARFQH